MLFGSGSHPIIFSYCIPNVEIAAIALEMSKGAIKRMQNARGTLIVIIISRDQLMFLYGWRNEGRGARHQWHICVTTCCVISCGWWNAAARCWRMPRHNRLVKVISTTAAVTPSLLLADDITADIPTIFLFDSAYVNCGIKHGCCNKNSSKRKTKESQGNELDDSSKFQNLTNFYRIGAHLRDGPADVALNYLYIKEEEEISDAWIMKRYQ